MSTITPSLEPGRYTGSKNITIEFDPNITQVEVTVNAAPPSTSRYIAYDNLFPASPLIAITEDGNTGRVVYDGGFPKFYNVSNPIVSSFAELTPGCKYLYNAINWVANSTKVLAGNNKILFIGDAPDNDPYPLKGSDETAFQNTFTNVADLANKVSTFMSASEFANNLLDPSLALLEQYPLVVFLSSAANNSNVLITPEAIDHFVKYRENGNGLIFITDHGYMLDNIEDVHKPEGIGFFKTANAITYNFGAYFSGDIDRFPVNVGFIRETYGDHPLYNNLTDDEYIYEGPSESLIFVTANALVTPDEIDPIILSKHGKNIINVYAVDSAGNSTIRTYVYYLQIDDFSIDPSVPSGYYPEAQSVKFTLPVVTLGYTYTVDTAPPALHQYLSFDRDTPPNPYLATTEDGRGRIFYDCGFVKYQNNPNGVIVNQFNNLTTGGKLMHNSIKWLSNPAKVNEGNNKVLFIIDAEADAEGNTTLNTLTDGSIGLTIASACAVAGVTEYRTRSLSDYANNVLNPSLSFMEEHACIVFVGINSSIATAAITQSAANSFVTYRENGNGLYFITAGGKDFNSLDDAINGPGTKTPGDFFKTVNAVVTKFGNYYTGSYDRIPENLAWIRANFGDHPVFQNIGDDETITYSAGGAKIMLVVSNLQTGYDFTLNVSKIGSSVINVLCRLPDGIVISDRFIYVVNSIDFLYVFSIDSQGGLTQNSTDVFTDIAARLNFQASITPNDLTGIWGEVLLNDKRVGEISNNINGSTTMSFYSGSAGSTKVVDGDVMTVSIRTPFEYTYTGVVETRYFTEVLSATKFPEVALKILSVIEQPKTQYTSVPEVVTPMMYLINKYLPRNPYGVPSLGRFMELVRNFSNGTLKTVESPALYIYDSPQATIDSIAGMGDLPHVIHVDASTGNVYGYTKEGVVKLIPDLKVTNFFAPLTSIQSLAVSNVSYVLNANGTLSKVV